MEALLPFALLLVAFYLLIIRPQRNRAKAAQSMQSRLAPGVEVMTTAGLFGTVVDVADDTVRVEVSPGVRVKFAKQAVGRIVLEDGDGSADNADATGEDTSDGEAEDVTGRTRD